MILLPVGLILRFAIWGIGKIAKKAVRIICYVLLVIIGLAVYGWMENNGFEFCYKGGCFN